MHYGWPSPFISVLKSGNYTFTISSEEGSWLVVMPLIGAIFGAIFGGVLLNTLGRKKIIVFSSIPFIVASLMVGFARSSILMFIGRLLAGFADGISFTAIPVYLSEIAEPKIRGMLASICPFCIALGVLLINVLGTYFSLNTVSFIAAGPPVLLLIIFSFMPESPYFCLIKGNAKKARETLQIFRGTLDVNEELCRIADGLKEESQNKASIWDLFVLNRHRKALIISLGLRGFQQLTGATCIIFYCKTVFEESEMFMSSTVATIMYFTVQLLLSAVSSFIVDLAGRKPLLILSTSGAALTLLFNGIYLYIKHCTDVDISRISFIPVAAMLCFIIVFGIGLQTMPLVVMGEIFQTDIKAVALCFLDMYYSFIVTVISKFFHWSNESFGMHVPFFTFAGCCILGLFFVIFFVPETKGKTLEEIQAEFRGDKKTVGQPPPSKDIVC